MLSPLDLVADGLRLVFNDGKDIYLRPQDQAIRWQALTCEVLLLVSGRVVFRLIGLEKVAEHVRVERDVPHQLRGMTSCSARAPGLVVV